MEDISRKKFNLGAVVEAGAKLGVLAAPTPDRYYG